MHNLLTSGYVKLPIYAFKHTRQLSKKNCLLGGSWRTSINFEKLGSFP